MSAKRANVFSQGRPENPYEDRDGPPDPPKRATAAQLAARKIKNVKSRRTAGASSAMSQSVNFGSAPQATDFGSPAPGDNAANSFNGFGGANATFGSSATNSFPPAQPAAPSASFANASFPAFGTSAQGTTFTPQPPTSTNFNFASGNSNQFAASAPAPTMPANGNSLAPAFGAGASRFAAPPQSSPFGSFGQSTTSAAPSGAVLGTAAPQNSTFGTASAAPPTSLFGTASPAPQNSTFGTASAAPQTSIFGTASAAPQTSSFGTASAAPQTSIFGTASAAPQTSLFGTASAAPQTSLFGTASPAPQNSTFGTASAAPQTSMFGTANPAPQTSTFSNASAAPTAATTPAPASTPFTFASTAPTAPSTATATASMHGGFGASTQTAPPATSNLFSFGSNAPTSDARSQPAPNNLFATSMATSAQACNSIAAAAPVQPSNLFNFGSTAPSSDASTPTLFGASSAAIPATSVSAPTPPSAHAPTLFGTSGPATPSTVTPALAPVCDPFPAFLPNPNLNTTNPSLFGSNPKLSAHDAPPYGNLTPLVKLRGASTETAQANPFATLQKPASTPAAASTAPCSDFNFLGASQQKSAPSEESQKSANDATIPAPPPSRVLSSFSTPQPTKTLGAGRLTGGLFNTVQSKPGTSIFAPTKQPMGTLVGPPGIPQPAFLKPTSFDPPTKPSTEAPKDGQTTAAMANPFSNQPTAASERPNLFNAPKEAPAVSPIPKMPALQEAAEASKEPQLPKVPKVHVPKDWAQPGSVATQGAQGLYQQLSDLTAQLQALNERYRRQLSTLPPTADWSAISHWHYQHALDIKKKIDDAKKQRAATKGITGNETALSTKRKVNEENLESPDPSPTKRARGSDAPATAISQSAAPTPSLQPTTTSTSSMFAKAINGTKPSSVPSVESNLFTPKTVENASVESAKPAPAASGFTPSSSASKSNGTSENPTPSFSGFKPNFGSTPTTGFKPASSSSSGGGSFMAQFKKTAKTYEELAAERKAKAKAADFDSDDETEEEWSARYDKKEAERLAEEKEKAAAITPTFSIPASTKPSSSTIPTAFNPFAALKTPAGAAPVPNASTCRASSPALSTGSQSVLDGPSNAPMPSNIFGNLSPDSSSNDQDDSDDEETPHAAVKPSADESVSFSEHKTTPKRKFGESETEDDEAREETMNHKRQNNGASSKGSLLSRMTRDPVGDAASENGANNATSFGQSNGAQTPANKLFFDFGAASSQSASPKSDSFAGDQTFKPGTPIKFGDAPATDKDSVPAFQIQPATPVLGESSITPAKQPAPSLFSFTPSGGGSSLLAANTGISSVGSMSSSAFSSRAGTPLSEADTNASAGENDEEEGDKEMQVDFSQLTEEEVNANEVIFHTDVVLAKHQVKDEGQKTWANLARGPLWILKDKTTAKCFVRLRLASGSTPLNYLILPSLRATINGTSKKMVVAMRPIKEGGLQSVLYCLRTPELAEEFASKYNESLPSN